MKTFYLFLKSKKTSLILWLVIAGIFFLIPSLYGLPLYAIGYAALLALSCTLICFWIEFSRFSKKHNELKQQQTSVVHDLSLLPAPENAIEADYTALISILFDSKQAFTTRSEKEWQETVDYYTLWAHQIKTPISAMRLLLQSEESDGLPQKSELTAELFSIEQYVEMALQFLRLDSTSTDYHFTTCELDQLLRGVIRKFAPVFIRKKISLEYEPLDLTVTTDEKWLAFVLEQLLSNALKYTKKGAIHIYAEQDAKKVLLIEDTGIGIRKEDLPRIFEKGYTGFNGRLDKRASGIGLYLTKRILDNLSHRITITSTPGVGTKVAIDFSQYEISPD